MTLTDRIARYLRSQPDWVSKSVIVALAQRHGYTYNAISDALNHLAHTPPYAHMYVSPDDRHTPLVSGAYYRYYDMPQDELRQAQERLQYFDALPVDNSIDAKCVRAVA